MFKRLLAMTAITVIALLVLVGCGASEPTPTPTPIPPTATPTPIPPTATPAENTPAEEGNTLKPYYAALENLTAYTATLVMDYQPAEGSGKEPFHVFFSEERVLGEPTLQRVRVRGLSTVDPEMQRNDATYTFIGDVTWFQAGEEQFYTTRPSQRRRLFLSPEDIIPDTAELKSEGPYPEQINGADVDYYTIANGDTLFGDGPNQPVNATLLQGDVWIARDGNYIARYIIRVQADDLKMRNEPTPGILTIEYNVTRLDPASVTIEPPEDGLTLDTVQLPGFEAGAFPYPEGAVPETLVQTLDQQMVVLNVTDMDLTEALAFYEEKLTAEGWQEIADDRQEIEGTFIGTTWEKGNDTLVLMIRPLPEGNGVQIVTHNGPTQ